MNSSARVRWPWARWSLARQLPLLTASLVVVVASLSLSLTYRELVQARADAVQERMTGVLRTLVTSSEAGTRARIAQFHAVTMDSSVRRALLLARTPGHATDTSTDVALLATLKSLIGPTDSLLPVELWTTDGHRVARVGNETHDDSVAARSPELRRLGRSTDSLARGRFVPTDSVQFGALYPSGGRVYFWSVAPVVVDGQRIGYIAQQRRIATNPATARMLRELSGEEVSLNFRNLADGFASTIDGRPMPAPSVRDTIPNGFVVTRDGERMIGKEARAPYTQIMLSLEEPRRVMTEGPRTTLRKLALYSVVLIVLGALIAAALSRQVVRPLVELTRAAEAIAQGDYGRRVSLGKPMADEVHRLSMSFDRMAEQVAASQQALATQVEDATRVSHELEDANRQLREATAGAEEARDAALHANQAKSDFLAVMSHELRTPLNAIGGYADILLMGIYGELNDAQRDAITRVTRSQQVLLSLINDVLNFAKLEAGEVQFELSDVPVADILVKLDTMVAPQLRDRKQSYEVEGCGDGVTVRSDPDKLQQVLINLLSNAIKYTPEGGAISLRCVANTDHVLLSVHDNGIGISADRLEKIFDPFVQVGRALNRPHEGVGLGLSISRDLAAGMGGSLGVTSTLGEGSTFTLRLPRGADRPA